MACENPYGCPEPQLKEPYIIERLVGAGVDFLQAQPLKWATPFRLASLGTAILCEPCWDRCHADRRLLLAFRRRQLPLPYYQDDTFDYDL